MFHSFIQYIEPILQTYGVFGMFLATLIEEIIAPIPSTLVVFTGGLLLLQGLEGSEVVTTVIFKIMLPASLGMTIGSLFPYYLARLGEKVAIDRFGKYLGVNWGMVEKMQRWSEKSKSDELLIFLTRAIPGMPSLATSLLAGLARIPVFEFVLWSFLGCLPRTFLIGLAGWWGGTKYGVIAEWVSSMESGVLIIIVAVLASLGLGWLIFEHKRRRTNSAPST